MSPTKPRRRPVVALATAFLWALGLGGAARGGEDRLEFAGGEGPGKGKHVVFVGGDDEYRSEEALPELAKILADRHGFRATVLFPIAKDGSVDPTRVDNIPGLEALDSADLMVIFARFRDLPADQMGHIAAYVDAGKPIVGLRTSTHAFKMKPNHPFAGFSFDNKEWDGGFGRQVLGETWIDHHGAHGKQATRGIIPAEARDNPIVRGIADGDIFGPTDVYAVRLPLSGDGKAVVLGQVVAGMKPTDPPAPGPKNAPMMPVAWTRTYTSKGGHTGRAFTTTMGASQDLLNEGVRRLLVNACYWAVGLEAKIPPRSEVGLIGDYKPHPFGFGTHAKGLRPADYAPKAGTETTSADGSPDGPGWVDLFDGKSLDGWIQRGGKASYKVEGGEIVGTTVANTPNSFLCTPRDYADFDLTLEFLVDDKLNSGVQVRSHAFDTPTEVSWKGKAIKVPANRVHGYQVEIDPAARAWTGGIYDESCRLWLDDLTDNEPARKAFRHEAWNTLRIECHGPSIKTWLNGVPAADLTDNLVPTGFLALQVHSVGKEEVKRAVRWRNLKIREFKPAPAG